MSNTYPFNCGRIGKVTPSEAASNAATIIVSSKHPRAVCLSPDGLVEVERVHEAVEADMLGVWRPGAYMELWRGILECLRHELAERGVAA